MLIFQLSGFYRRFISPAPGSRSDFGRSHKHKGPTKRLLLEPPFGTLQPECRMLFCDYDSYSRYCYCSDYHHHHYYCCYRCHHHLILVTLASIAGIGILMFMWSSGPLWQSVVPRRWRWAGTCCKTELLGVNDPGLSGLL